MQPDYNTVKMAHLGCLNVLCELHVYVATRVPEADEAESLRMAVEDGAAMHGLKVRRILNRLELVIPDEPEIGKEAPDVCL